jgi:hypothetical protein
MARRQGTLGRRTTWIYNLTEIRQASGVHVLTLVGILVWIRMLDHATSRLRFLDDPRTIAFLQIIGYLHARPRRRAGLWPEFNFGVRLIPIDGNAPDIHLHGAHIESAHAVEVLQDAGADGVVVARLLLASGAK